MSSSDPQTAFAQYATNNIQAHSDPMLKFDSCVDLLPDEFKNRFVTSSQSQMLSILHLNIRSLNANNSELKLLLECLNVSFDIIALSEIWSNNVEYYKNLLPGYTLSYELPDNSNVGGVGAFISDGVKFCKIIKYNIAATGSNKVEQIWFEAEKERFKFNFACVYRHPAGNINDFTNELDKSLTNLARQPYPTFITGDLNIDVLKYNTHSDTRNYLNIIEQNHSILLSLLPTRITRDSSTLIDHHIFCRAKFKPKHRITLATGNILTDITDHLANYTLITKDKVSNADSNSSDGQYIRIFSKRNREKFHNDIKNSDWTTVINEQQVDNAYDSFITLFNDKYDKCFPLTLRTPKHKKDKFWITKGLTNSAKNKNRLYKTWIKNKQLSDFEKYRDYKKEFNKLKKLAIDLYYKNIFQQHAKDTKKVWKALNQLCSFSKNNNRQKRNTISSINMDNKTLDNPQSIVEGLNQHFTEIGNKIAKDIPTATTSYTQYLPSPSLGSFVWEDINDREVYKELMKLKSNKKSSLEGYNTSVIADTALYIARPLQHIFNLSYGRSKVPEKFKMAKVIPLFKKGEITDPGNYRPISLLSIFSKILEKLMYKRITKYTDKFKILSTAQYGFRKSHSTTLSLIETFDKIYEYLDKGEKVMGIFLDFQKAFDCINHDILLHKLYHYGFRGNIYSWFKDYLNNRYQYTNYNSTNSETLRCNIGVPQGSILGPFLFLIYINDFPNAAKPAESKLFADDSNLFTHNKDKNQLTVETNIILTHVHDWTIANRLCINYEKSNYMLFQSKHTNQATNTDIIAIGNHELTNVSSVKYLGIQIDQHLTWQNHIEEVYKKIVKFTGIFYKIRDSISPNILKQLYFATVYPIVQYGIEIYANTKPTYLKHLRTLNNKILRILQYKDRKSNTKDLYQAYGTLDINSLHEHKLLLLGHKLRYNNDSLPEIYNQYIQFNFNIHNHNTRNSIDNHVHSCRTETGKRNLKYKISKLWNNLPTTTKQITSFNLFKKLYKKK